MTTSAQPTRAKALRKARIDVAEQELEGRLLDLQHQLDELVAANLTGNPTWIKAALSLAVLSAREATAAHAALVKARGAR